MPSVGSLFAGIGGFDLGLERAGFTTAWQVEADPFRRSILAAHWPDVARHEDVRDVGAHNLDPVDVICGGFPCQDLSDAGGRAGIEGARSGLWSEMLRVVRELGPSYIIVENVRGILGRGLGRVLMDLAEGGYDAEWDCLPASAFGAPHQRDRFWLVAYPGQERCEGAESPGSQASLRRQALDEGRETASDPAEARRREGESQPCFGGEWRGSESRVRLASHPGQSGRAQDKCTVQEPSGRGQSARRSAPDSPYRWVAPGRGFGLPQGSLGARHLDSGAPEPLLCRVDDGLPNRLDRVAALGDALVPQIAEWIGRRILEWEAVNA